MLYIYIHVFVYLYMYVYVYVNCPKRVGVKRIVMTPSIFINGLAWVKHILYICVYLCLYVCVCAWCVSVDAHYIRVCACVFD